jgi:hypothetical protein
LGDFLRVAQIVGRMPLFTAENSDHFCCYLAASIGKSPGFLRPQIRPWLFFLVKQR